MIFCKYFILFILQLICASDSGLLFDPSWSKKTKAYQLTVDNINLYKNKERHLVIEFYKETCFHCGMLADQYNKIWEKYNGPDSTRNDILITQIDANKYPQLMNEYHITDTPSILFIEALKNDKFTLYDSSLTTFDKISEWVDKEAGPIRQLPKQIIITDTIKGQTKTKIEEPKIQNQKQSQIVQSFLQEIDILKGQLKRVEERILKLETQQLDNQKVIQNELKFIYTDKELLNNNFNIYFFYFILGSLIGLAGSLLILKLIKLYIKPFKTNK